MTEPVHLLQGRYPYCGDRDDSKPRTGGWSKATCIPCFEDVVLRAKGKIASLKVYSEMEASLTRYSRENIGRSNLE